MKRELILNSELEIRNFRMMNPFDTCRAVAALEKEKIFVLKQIKKFIYVFKEISACQKKLFSTNPPT